MPSSDTPRQAQLLAETFAAQCERWSHSSGASAATARYAGRAAFLVSQALSAGDVCMALDDLALALEIPAPQLAEHLHSSGVVGQHDHPGVMPLILDADGRLYLHRYFDYEVRLARNLTLRTRQPQDTAFADGVRHRLLQRFADDRQEPPDWQQIAAAMALLGRLTLISGGPGTGKTTTVVNLLACLLEQNPDCRIALAAPTGKAAARMTEALRLRAVHLAPELQARLPGEAFTIHRLLGYNPAAGGFRHHAEQRLAIDALVVDEASMLDLALATQLLEAVPDHARVILLGDKDQLAAVESGAVFAELSANPALSPKRREQLANLCGLAPEAITPPQGRTGLVDNTIWLSRNFRFAGDSGIGQLAREINQGEADAALARLRAASGSAVTWLEDAGKTLESATLERLQAGFADYLATLQNTPDDLPALFRAFDRCRVLCAVREGQRGVEALNQSLARRFRKDLEHPLDPGEPAEWYPGRPVMVLRNDYVLKLFNGDIGLILPNQEGVLMARFPDREAGYRAIPPARLPEHETAFAMTVHKSQGSEFDAVLVLLPAEPQRVLTRELVYTAITRARQQVTLIAGESVLTHAIRNPTRRHSGLDARLKETAR